MLAVLGALLAVLATSQPAAASHFRATSLTWQLVSGTTVDFQASISYRCTFFFASCPAVGTTFNADVIQFGDGTFSNSQWTVVSTNPANNVMNVEKQATRTYTSPGPFTARVNQCCRLSPPQHVNNPDDVLNAETLVSFATAHSPESGIAPIVDCAKNSVCQFFVPATDADSGETLRWRLAASTEAGSSTFNQPGPPHAPNAATIDATTGLYRWDTTGAQLNLSGDTYYSTQVVVENLVGSTVVSKIPVDFFIRLADTSSNQPPVFVSPPTPADGDVITVNAGDPVSFGVTAQDPNAADTVGLTVLGMPAGATFTPTPGNPATGTFNWPAASGTSVILTLQAQDQNGLGATPRSITINVVSNQPPVAGAGGPYTGDEGASIAISGTATDADSDPVATTWSVVGDVGNDSGAACVIADPSALTTTVTCNDDGLWSLTLAADDGNGGTDSETVSLTVDNVAPSIDITSPADWTVAAMGSSVAVSTDVSDPGPNDAPSCNLDWGDGSTDTAACSGSHTFGSAGIYTITASADDADGGTASDTVRVVVYDPSAGFVTGGGTVDSPLGAYVDNPSAAGQANFGFVSKYKKGATVPEGQTEFQFHAGGLNFHSSSYQWLVVAGSKAQFKGAGTLNGGGGYSFMVTAVDGGKSAPDKFRMKIWDADGTVYDNMMGAADEATPTDIKSGSVVIHK